MSDVRLAVVGASGRMGKSVLRLAPELGFRVTRAVSRDVHAITRDETDVIIDFSVPEATRALCAVVTKEKVPLVSGTTGLDDGILAALDDAAAHAPVFWEPNMSLGVHVLVSLARETMRKLGPEFDVEVTETHHKMKVDAPSGTALRLVEKLAEARDRARVVHGREGRPGPRPAGEIGLFALRGGDVIGDHTVHFLGLGERMEITHRATSRDVFARGALRAAAFVAGKPPGRYGLDDVVR